MDRNTLIRDMRRIAKSTNKRNEHFIDLPGLCKFLGRTRNTVLRLVSDVPHVSGRWYYIPEVADALLARTKYKN